MCRILPIESGLRFAAAMLLCGAVVMAFSGCASVRLDYVDASLTPSVLSQGRIALAGVVSREGVGEIWSGEADQIANSAEAVLKKKRRDVEVIGIGEFRRATGRGRRGKIQGGNDPLLRLHDHEALKRAQREGVSHALVIELTGNEIAHWGDQDCDHQTHYEYDEDGNVVGCHTDTTYITSANSRREVAARFLLYDLVSLAPVWAVSSDHSKLATNSRRSAISYPPPPPAPKPPDVGSVVGSMTKGAIKQLPRERGWF